MATTFNPHLYQTSHTAIHSSRCCQFNQKLRRQNEESLNRFGGASFPEVAFFRRANCRLHQFSAQSILYATCMAGFLISVAIAEILPVSHTRMEMMPV